MSASRRWRVAALLVVAAVSVGGGALALNRQAQADASSSAGGPPIALPAKANMSALATARIAPAGIAVLERVPAAYRSDPGAARVLLEKAGGTNFSLYAWTRGASVCKQSSRGGGGCFSEFLPGEHAAVTASDPDGLGSGAPLYVWGVVADDVVAVDVIVDGTPHAALVENNALFYELSEGELGPQLIESFVVKLRDGTEQVIRFS